ncbi:thymidylate synthase, partial [Bacillus vallismortis]|nr:thymidylate synthase [Bacillus vallismortis]
NLQPTRHVRPHPKLRFAREVDSIFNFSFEDFIIEDYDPHTQIKGAVSV